MINKEMDYTELIENCIAEIHEHAFELFSILPNGILITYNNEIVYYNKHFSDMLAISEQNSLEDRKTIKRLLALPENEHEANVPYQIEVYDKSLGDMWIEIVMNQELMPNHSVCKVYTIKDITKDKNSSQRIIEMSKQFKAIFEDSKNAIAMYEDGNIIQLNNAFVTMFGLRARHESLGKSILSIVAEEERDRIKGFIKGRIEGKDINEEYTTKCVRKDGLIFDVKVNVSTYMTGGKMIGVVTVEDISKQIDAQNRLQESNIKLKKSLLSMVTAMVKTVEARDPYAAGHQQRVAMLSTVIGKELGFSKFKLEGLSVGAQIHDIGATTIPTDIIIKKTPLNDCEMNLIRDHAVTGAKMLEGIDFLWPIQDIVHQHHERVDGSGYPRGLKGDEIIIEAKIVAVADVFEAMSSNRPYREALTKKEALDELKINKGILYDEKVVEAVVKLIEVDHNKVFDLG